MSVVRAAADGLLAAAGVTATHHVTRTSAGGIVHHIEAGSGDPVVLVHGGGGGCANWFRIIGPLSRRFHVLAPDLPGFGESTPSRAHGALGTQAAEFLAKWLDSVGVRTAAVVGTSFGALAALRLALAEPARVERLALVDAVGLGTSVAVAVRLGALPVVRNLVLRPSRRGGTLLFDRLLTGGRVQLPGALREPLLDYLWACDTAGVAMTLRRTLPRFTGLVGQRERLTAEQLAAVRVPTLIVWGRRDRFVPVRHAERAARVIPGAALVVIEDAGHSPNWETPDELLAALQPFLARAPAAGA